MTADRDEHGRAVEWRPMKIRIERMHLEEDAGKNVHEGLPDTDKYSYVDLNRAGTPLGEIVTHPDFRTSWQAFDYVNHVRHALRWVGASDADMEKGNLRCEANVSVRRVGDQKFGTKVELKNLNSVRFMQRAIEFEVARHIKTLESGGRLSQETRLWDEKAVETRVMRSKEEAHDYRYFPEPDLAPLEVSNEFIERVRSEMPELPDARKIASSVAAGVADGRSIAIHCRAGIGRSSVVAACAMICLGSDAGDALSLIKKARGVSVPDTEAQRDWIFAFGTADA
jgi:aspartyl-tRNA(Asn)/glutamyl-tRNA(Gln) amidotransferase subunit B